MFLSIWNFLRGYVIIDVSGFSVERFMNLAAYRGVYLWDVERKPDRAVMRVSVKAFRLLRPCARKTRCMIRIVGKRGAPFIAYRYRKRKLLAFGVLFFATALFLLSNFIWYVGVTGADRIEETEILAYLEGQGVKPGVFKAGVDRKTVQQGLLDEFPDIAWVNLEIQGTRATVQLAEGIPQKEIEDTATPVDIVAAKDGLITGIATSAGTPLVKPGDVVSAGDVLVSGLLTVGNEETGVTYRYVHAESEVRAKMYYMVSLEVPYAYTEHQPTGESSKGFSIKLFGNTLNIFNRTPDYPLYGEELSEWRLSFGEDYPLPFVVVTHIYSEMESVAMERAADEAEAYGSAALDEFTLDGFGEDAVVLDSEVTYTRTQDVVLVEAFITTEERIDVEREIVFPAEETDAEGLPEEAAEDDGTEEE